MTGKKKLTASVLGALAAGLCLFLAVESAVARRVGIDLLLPWSTGAFLPGRLARMGAALVLTFALALTERGKSLRHRLDGLCRSVWGCWALSAVVTGLLLAWTLRVTVLSFLISDDPVAVKIIASMPELGMEVGTRTFSNVLFCAMLSLLYKIAPNGYWYTIYHVGMQVLALWVLGWCILQKTARRGWPALAGCFVFGLFCAGVFSYTFGAVTFTLTAAMTGTAAVALVLCRDERTSLAGRIGSDVFGAVLMVLCTLQREACGDALFCFWGLAVGYQLLKMLVHRDKKWLRRAAALVLAAVLTLALPGYVMDLAPVEADHYYRYSEFYRSLIEDYLIDHMTDEQFAAVGYPPELVPLLRYWFFMDERVTTDSFEELEYVYFYGIPDQEDAEAEPAEADDDVAPVEPAAAEADTADSAAPAKAKEPSALQVQLDRLRGLSGELDGLIRADATMGQLTALVLALLAWCLAAFWRSGRGRWLESLASLCAVGGSFILSLYLIESAYLPLRAYQVIVFPASVTLLLLFLSGPAPAAGGRARRIGAGALWLAGAAAAGMLCVAGVYQIPRATTPDTRADAFGPQWAAEAYAHANPDVTIINNAYFLIFDPIHRVADYPTNLVWWGACGDLAKPASQRLYADAFFRDDVQFMTQNPASVSFLMQYLTLDYGPVQIVNTYRLSGGINIYDVDQVRPEEDDYTGWYKQNGMTYYFRDGKALTGEQVIDGETYTFAPIGVNCMFSAQFTDDALVYTTDAYSLVTPEE